MTRARARREQPRGDSMLRNYSAKATGFVYFYLDRNEADDRTPVKVDQIALELFWAAPNLTKQRIVGLRDQSLLPNRMRYHLDHLTVVQNGFGDVIRLGDGDEVQDVPHPAARASDTVYDFRLADSLELNFPPQPPVRVFEIQVRPRNRDRSGMIGSIFIDQASADIVRMTFTFTPASYVDKRLDYINISLDNGLWSGSYWLPNEQYVEIRRQIPELDFVAGAVIKGRLRVHDYKFNQPIPRDFFFGRPVEAVSEEERKNFAFEEDILAGLNREELGPIPQIDVLRAEALRIIRGKKLSGLPGLRLHIPNASSILRFNRSEGVFVGVGAIYVPAGPVRFNATAGYAFAARKPGGSLTARVDGIRNTDAALRLYYREPRDVGSHVALPTGLNTVSSLFGDDYTDTYYARGAELLVSRPFGVSGNYTVSVGAEQHENVGGVREPPFGDKEFRATIEVDRGTLAFARVSLGAPIASSNSASLRLRAKAELGRLKSEFFGSIFTNEGAYTTGTYLRPELSLNGSYLSPEHETAAHLQVSIGGVAGKPPIQKVFFLGGLGTLPGNPYRGMVGKRYALIEGEVSRAVWTPWVRLRAIGAAGQVGGTDLPWMEPVASYRSATSIGLGVGLFWDVLRFDLVRGSQGNRVGVFFSVPRDFWDMM
jgi:hypothetical protein